MINKKLIVGVLAILVLLTSLQGMRPVSARVATYQEYPGNSIDGTAGAYRIFMLNVDSGQGTLCWSSDNFETSNSCSQSMTFVPVQVGSVLTITAKGADGYNFAYWETIDSSGQTTTVKSSTLVVANNVAVNPYNAPFTADQYLLANFTPA